MKHWIGILTGLAFALVATLAQAADFKPAVIYDMDVTIGMILDELVYSPGGDNNSMVMNLIQGTFVFVTGKVAPTGSV